MPHMTSVVRLANRFLDPTDERSGFEQSVVRDALGEASSLYEALRAIGALDGLDDRVRDDTEKLLRAMPSSVENAVLGALKSGTDRSLPVVLQWKPGTSFEASIWEATDGDVGQVGVLITTPFARDV